MCWEEVLETHERKECSGMHVVRPHKLQMTAEKVTRKERCEKLAPRMSMPWHLGVFQYLAWCSLSNISMPEKVRQL